MEQAAAAAIVDARGTVTGWSEGARRLTGYTAEEVVGRAAQDLLAEDVPLPGLTALTGTAVLRHRDGHPVPLCLSVHPVTGADGAPQGSVVTTAPATADSVLVARAFQQAPVAMSVFDLGQRYIRANNKAGEILRVDADTLTGRYLPDTVADDESGRRFHRHLRRVAETGLPVHYAPGAPRGRGSPRARPRRPSGSETPTPALPSRRPRGPCARAGPSCAGPARPTSTAGCRSATPAGWATPRTAGAPTPCRRCHCRPAEHPGRRGVRTHRQPRPLRRGRRRARRGTGEPGGRLRRQRPPLRP
ncbi:PAS domain-containing protein [Streptomyces sp. NPDC001848]|uniref:PAS domain-containing protein n=1 Tax=Streptomyces sp. NPDC001848 TaxID=3364618 RepID=UPI0036A2E41C